MIFFVSDDKICPILSGVLFTDVDRLKYPYNPVSSGQPTGSGIQKQFLQCSGTGSGQQQTGRNKKRITTKISQAPDFFKQSPLVIDLHQLTELQINLDLRTLIQTLRELKLLPIGIQGGTDRQHKIALEMGVPPLSARLLDELQPRSSLPPEEEQQEIEETVETVTEVSPIENKLITHPVRSGQRVYSQGDLTILAQVSAGAEVLAEGNIHVYGSLRGRALAGVQGDTESRIFCSDLRAELISIAGTYCISDELGDNLNNKPVQIFLQENKLIIKELTPFRG